jgi:hypothetical protein
MITLIKNYYDNFLHLSIKFYFNNIVQKYKNDNNDKLVFRLKFITLKDYDELNPYEAIKYDKRSFLILFFNNLTNENVMFNLLFYNSVLEPLWIRIIMFYFNLSLMFAASAFFFSDDFIDARASLSEEERV